MVAVEKVKHSFAYLWPTQRRAAVVLIAVIIVLGALFPKPFVNVWLTQDQQAYISFLKGDYASAATRFSNVHWQAYSLYGAEQFKQSAIIFGQFSGTDYQFSRANAYAHAGEYLKARDIFLQVIKTQSDHAGSQRNLAIVLALIEDINRMSESQQPEEGDTPKALGDAPKRADGADKKESRTQEIEQYSADQLLLDPDLNAMWLRQVQKDPAVFLANKFNIQLQAGMGIKNDAPTPITGADHNAP